MFHILFNYDKNYAQLARRYTQQKKHEFADDGIVLLTSSPDFNFMTSAGHFKLLNKEGRRVSPLLA